jgi:hypothetical protein
MSGIRIDGWARRFLLVKTNVWGKGRHVWFIVIFTWSWKEGKTIT